MNKLLAFVTVLLLSGQVLAQQKPQYTQYTLNNYLLNPAISGIEDYVDLKLGTRQQWSGLEGAPVSYYATIHTPINKDMTSTYSRKQAGGKSNEISNKSTNVYRRVKAHHGVGGMLMTTKTGPLKRSSANVSYAYHLPVSRTTRVSAGIAPGVIQYSLDQNYVKTGNPMIDDPAIVDGRVNELKFNLDLGLWLYSQNYYLGVAGSQLVPSKRQYIDTGSPEYNNAELQKHYFVTGGYRLDVMYNLTVIPSVMIKMAQPSPASVDATVKALYAERLWAGISYRHKESFAAMAGINVSHLMDIAYSYDASTSPLGVGHAGSHEVVLGFKLRNSKKVICPSWAW
ncbi:type IX secretion system membrane protein PorP/SprF [Pontibacter silvestris]|uniref:Type IX secretion system membrane protein PorP/SprF n=1 Tax=Pontibacter silvestris TaxID=2305183 RepID=A0ABW4X1Y6_9BACT|nr:type IX secretion system membrane protein PorP/SprF [Pontibacter silvestris]MCC9135026.1 type IX secretion system membrane protein PorP/SprF [Pontibacter silvestris]